MDRNKPHSSDSFEDQLRVLSPRSADPALENRIRESLKPSTSRWNWTTAAAAAFVLFAGLGYYLAAQSATHETADPISDFRPVGHQKVLVDASPPRFVEIPGSEPMWQIDLRTMNRAFIQTPSGVQASEFVTEDRSVFVPVVYH